MSRIRLDREAAYAALEPRVIPFGDHVDLMRERDRFEEQAEHAEDERDALREALGLARAVKFEHHAIHEMRMGEDCVICAKPSVQAMLERIAVLAAPVPPGPDERET